METLILGGYTRSKNKGISTVVLDKDTKTLNAPVLVSEIESPTYLESVGDFIFSVVKDADWAGVALLEKDGQTYRQIATALTEGVNPPCYVSFDRKRQFVYSASYHHGFFDVMAITEDGLEIVNVIEHEGSSVHENQQSSHVHYVKADRSGEYVLVCDLGTDEVYTYNIFEQGAASIHSVYKSPAGFGPRHLVEHPTLPIVYVLGELSNEVVVCRYEDGKLEQLDIISTLPSEFNEWSATAAIRLSSDGKFLYASNRGHDSIVVYRVLETGLLEMIDIVKSGGKTPRDFNFNADETFIVVGHQDDHVLSLFERDVNTGKITCVDDAQIAHECVCVAHL